MSRRTLASRKVVFGGGAEPVFVAPGWLTIDGSRIAAVGRFAEGSYRRQLAELAVQTRGELQDFSDRLLTPAFVNSHTHLTLGFLRGSLEPESARGNLVWESLFAVESRLSEADVLAFARMGAFESLLHGVGLVWDHYYHGGAVAKALLETGLGGVVAPTLQDLAGPGEGAAQLQLQATADIARSRKLSEAGVFAAIGPHATDTVSTDLWRRAVTTAAELDLPIHCHLAQSIEEFRSSMRRWGCSPAAWLHSEGLLAGSPTNVLAHGLFVSRRDLALLAPERDTLVFCPCSQLVFGFPARPSWWAQAGIGWTVATDCSASNDSFNLQKELRAVAGQRTNSVSGSPSYRDFFESGSETDAESVSRLRDRTFEDAADLAQPSSLLDRVWHLPGRLHPGFRAGTLETGALANVVVWDLDHPSFWPDADGLQTLAMGDTTQAIHAMFVAGREIGECGDFHRSLVDSPAYLEARAEADARLRGVRLAGGLEP